MNEQVTRELSELPELPDDVIDRLERGVFDDIAAGRADERRRSRRRRRTTWGALGAVAAVAACVVVVPMIGQSIAGGVASDSAVPQSGGGYEDGSVEGMSQSGDGSAGSGSSGGEASADESAAVGDAAEAERQVIRTGFVDITVDDVSAASDELTKLAAEYDGYVDSLGSSGTGEASYGWISLRIPADDLDTVRAALGDIGDVTSVEITESDVTAQSVDLQARISSLTASVGRLETLMSKAGSVDELLQAEASLSERQAELEALQSQLDHLDDQVAMSSLSIDIAQKGSTTKADPAGFGDGFFAGWNGLVVFLNALVIGLGFVLPWLVVIGVAWLVIWFLIRMRRRRRSRA